MDQKSLLEIGNEKEIEVKYELRIMSDELRIQQS